jgi:hypothetical protein
VERLKVKALYSSPSNTKKEKEEEEEANMGLLP